MIGNTARATLDFLAWFDTLSDEMQDCVIAIVDAEIERRYSGSGLDKHSLVSRNFLDFFPDILTKVSPN